MNTVSKNNRFFIFDSVVIELYRKTSRVTRILEWFEIPKLTVSNLEIIIVNIFELENYSLGMNNI